MKEDYQQNSLQKVKKIFKIVLRQSAKEVKERYIRGFAKQVANTAFMVGIKDLSALEDHDFQPLFKNFVENLCQSLFRVVKEETIQ